MANAGGKSQNRHFHQQKCLNSPSYRKKNGGTVCPPSRLAPAISTSTNGANIALFIKIQSYRRKNIVSPRLYVWCTYFNSARPPTPVLFSHNFFERRRRRLNRFAQIFLCFTNARRLHKRGAPRLYVMGADLCGNTNDAIELRQMFNCKIHRIPTAAH